MARQPTEREFSDLFEAAGANVVRAAELLERLLEAWPDAPELAGRIRDCEHEGDRITHAIVRRLNESVSPRDREDVYRLASALDDIVDFVEEVSDFLGLYRIEATMEPAIEMGRILHQAAVVIAQAILRMSALEDVHEETVEVHRLENEGDRVSREALASLFEHGVDPMLVIRWKDIFERLEEAIDATERTANVLEGIAITRRSSRRWGR